jgi:hypothetical protein
MAITLNVVLKVDWKPGCVAWPAWVTSAGDQAGPA